MSLIVLKNIKKEYGKNQVLFNDLSLVNLLYLKVYSFN